MQVDLHETWMKAAHKVFYSRIGRPRAPNDIQILPQNIHALRQRLQQTRVVIELPQIHKYHSTSSQLEESARQAGSRKFCSLFFPFGPLPQQRLAYVLVSSTGEGLRDATKATFEATNSKRWPGNEHLNSCWLLLCFVFSLPKSRKCVDLSGEISCRKQHIWTSALTLASDLLLVRVADACCAQRAPLVMDASHVAAASFTSRAEASDPSFLYQTLKALCQNAFYIPHKPCSEPTPLINA